MADKTIRVMLSDDSPHVRQHLRETLATTPSVTIVAETTDVATTIETVSAEKPDVIVLDIQMPDGSGITALKHIKRELVGTRIIMLTNHANSFYERVCRKFGVDRFFDKSEEFEKVGPAIQELASA